MGGLCGDRWLAGDPTCRHTRAHPGRSDTLETGEPFKEPVSQDLGFIQINQSH